MTDPGPLVVVTGLPGSGKTTIAGPLAAELGWPLLGKDTIKEALFDALGTGDLDRDGTQEGPGLGAEDDREFSHPRNAAGAEAGGCDMTGRISRHTASKRACFGRPP